MQAIVRDIRYGFRSLVKSPGLAIVAAIALTLGIGLTTTMFSIVYGVLLKGLPYPDGDRIVAVYRNNTATGNQRMSVPIADYADYAAGNVRSRRSPPITPGTVNVSGVGQAERYTGAWVTASVFDIARTAPLLGRAFRPDENVPNGPKVALISYGMWKTRFGGEPECSAA